MNKNLKKIIYKLIIVFGIVVLLAIISDFFVPLKNLILAPDVINFNYKYEDYKLRVHFLNVGNADCSYIHCGESDILIDAADIEPYGFVSQYLIKQELKKLDLAVVSHQHRDHIGQMADVLEKFYVDMFMMPEVSKDIIPETISYMKLIKILKKKNVKRKKVKPGDVFYIGDLKIDVLGPIRKHINLNNNSIVLKLTYKNVSFLFVGDAEREEENSILNENFSLKSTVLKVGHHGSNTSSTSNFIKNIRPRFSVISAAADKPLKNVVRKRFEALSSEIFLTYKSGNLLFLSDGNDIKIIKEQGKAA